MRLKPAYGEETRVSVDLGFGDAERHCKHFLKARSFSAGDAADDLGNGKGRVLRVAFSVVPPLGASAGHIVEIAKEINDL